MLEESKGTRFIEFVIATTIGSIVGAYIARDIEFNLNLVIRAVFAVAILSVFFFCVYKASSSWGKKKKPMPGEEIVPEEALPEEEFKEEYSEEEGTGKEEH